MRKDERIHRLHLDRQSQFHVRAGETYAILSPIKTYRHQTAEVSIVNQRRGR